MSQLAIPIISLTSTYSKIPQIALGPWIRLRHDHRIQSPKSKLNTINNVKPHGHLCTQCLQGPSLGSSLSKRQELRGEEMTLWALFSCESLHLVFYARQVPRQWFGEHQLGVLYVLAVRQRPLQAQAHSGAICQQSDLDSRLPPFNFLNSVSPTK